LKLKKTLQFDKLFAISFYSLQMILREVDSLLYVDTDVLFLQPVELIWDMLALFNSTQLVAMAPEHEEPRIAWYSRFSRHPYYGRTGINSGVMLMNLTRMRRTQFKVRLEGRILKSAIPIYLKSRNTCRASWPGCRHLCFI